MPDAYFNKNNLYTGIIISIIIIILYIYFDDPVRSTSSVVFRGETYNVQHSYKNKLEAAKLIAEINARILQFLAYLKNKYHINIVGGDLHPRPVDGISSAKLEKMRGIIERILENFNPEVVIENDPQFSSDTSYTINKGSKLYLCLRQKDNIEQLHDIDLMMFIVLHELSHMGTITYGHNTEFWTTFKFILFEAMRAGIYQPINFRTNNKKYCGLNVDYNPLYDRGLANIWK